MPQDVEPLVVVLRSERSLRAESEREHLGTRQVSWPVGEPGGWGAEALSTVVIDVTGYNVPNHGIGLHHRMDPLG